VKEVLNDKFFEDYWMKSYYHLKNIQYMEFNSGSIEKILRDQFLEPRDFLLAKNGQFVNEQLITSLSSKPLFNRRERIVDSSKALKLVNSNKCSLKIFSVNRWSRPVSTTRESLQRLTNHYCSANLYYTPANGCCFSRHKDGYDIFIYQVEGSKEWYLGDINEEDGEKESKESDVKIVLNAGDILYLPANIAHYAKCTSDASIHVTFGLHRPDYFSMYEYFLEKLRPKYQKEFEMMPSENAYNKEALGNKMSAMQVELKALFSQPQAVDEFINYYLNESISIKNTTPGERI
tara:strand:- start:229188 stop:230060 length:873 start_codon:yes stop_codon:yes gene_type:complete